MTEKAEIFYKDIGDYLSREEKLKIVSEGISILNPAMNMSRLTPNKHGDWINLRNDVFSSFIPLEPEQKFDNTSHSFFTMYSLGIATNKDAWLYNFSYAYLEKNIKRMVSYYNNQRVEYQKLIKEEKVSPEKWVTYDASKITWTDMFLKDLGNNVNYQFEKNKLCNSLYRPFITMRFCYEKQFIQRTYQQEKLFPTINHTNTIICVSGIGSTKPFSALITNVIPCLDLVEKSQCFSLY